ncbi:MAG TPA: M48 family metalloprotease [Candidatus Dormibacteraeota bacterium]|nr:M48 family metalloprotease [Candidatus Dormibacteraeota bacterium]
MKIYISQNNQELGPYSPEEVRELVYKGEVQHSAMARSEVGADWAPIDTILGRSDLPPATSAPPTIPMSIERLRDPKEKTALTLLYVAAVPGGLLLTAWTVASFGIVLLVMAFVALLVLIGELWFSAYVRTNAVRVSETQLPDLFKVVQSCCERLGMSQPEVYIMQQNVWNAFATKALNRRMVVLLSGAVDSILLKGDMQQIAFLVGHELGHHRAGHLDFSRKLADLGDWCIWLKLWYSRRAEFTCDRMGLFCSGSLKASQLAIINATVGAQLASKVDLNEAAAQWHQYEREFFVRYRTFYATHPHLLARVDYLAKAATELGVFR